MKKTLNQLLTDNSVPFNANKDSIGASLGISPDSIDLDQVITPIQEIAILDAVSASSKSEEISFSDDDIKSMTQMLLVMKEAEERDNNRFEVLRLMIEEYTKTKDVSVLPDNVELRSAIVGLVELRGKRLMALSQPPMPVIEIVPSEVLLERSYLDQDQKSLDNREHLSSRLLSQGKTISVPAISGTTQKKPIESQTPLVDLEVI